MSTLKTHNLQSPDAGSVNIVMAPNAGMVVAGLSTYSNQINVGSNIKLATAGVVTATSFVGSGSNLTGIISDKIFEGNTKAEVVDTGSDGKFIVETEGTQRLEINSTGNITLGTASATGNKLYFQSASGAAQYIASGGTNNRDLLIASSSGTWLSITSTGEVNIGGNFTETSHPFNISHSTKPSLALHTGTTLRADFSATSGITSIRSYANNPFTINIGGSGETEALRITSDGQTIINGTTNLGHPNMDDIVVGDGTGNRGITIASGTSNYSSVAFGDSNDGSGADRYEGLIEYFHNDDSLTLYTAHIPRLRIDSSGLMGLGTNNPQKNLHVYASSVATVRIETGDSRGQAWDLLSTNGAGTNTGTLSFRNEAGSSYLDLAANGGSPKTTFRNGGSNDLLIVDNNGIVTIPYQPAFRSYTTSDGNGNGTVTGIWVTGSANNLRFDNNDDFTDSNGRFTAPVDGVYQISVAWDENNTATVVDVKINGSIYLYSSEPHVTGGWETLYTNSITKLSAGDYVTIDLRNASGSYPFHQNNGRWGHFSAYLIA